MDHTLLGRHSPRLDASPKSKRCSRCRSWTCCSTRSACIARTTQPNTVQMSTLLSIKTGACPEDCAYCPQSVRYDTGLERETLLEIDEVRDARARARRKPAPRASAWAPPTARRSRSSVAVIAQMIREVRALGMETCATLGMLTPEQAQRAARTPASTTTTTISTPRPSSTARSSPRAPTRIGSTRSTPCATPGSRCAAAASSAWARPSRDRAQLLLTLANLPEHPESVPINQLVQVPGTPLHGAARVDPFDFVRTIAVARILMPRAHVRLSAGPRGR